MIFAINGYEFNNLVVIDYKFSTEILDSEGTGRTQGVGWKMMRFPEGVIINLAIRIGSKQNNSLNPDFLRLLKELNEFGQKDFKKISLIAPDGKMEQMMYAPGYEASMQRIRKDGTTFWNPIDIRFIAQEAYIT